MKSVYDVIKRPIVTERSMAGMHDKRYTFEVDRRANKYEIKEAVEAIFKVNVDKVNTISIPAKKKRLSMGQPEGTKPAFKKAVVTLSEKSKTIEFFDSLM